MGRSGGPTVVFALSLSIFLWLASLANIIQTYNMCTYSQVQCSVWNGHPVSLFPLSKLWKEPTSPSLILWYGHFHIFLSKLTRFYTIKAENFLGEDPQTPPPLPDTIYYIKTTMFAIATKKTIPYRNVNYEWSENKFECKQLSWKSIYTLILQKWKNNQVPCFVSSSSSFFFFFFHFFFFFFFFACQIFSWISWTPTDENSWIRACTLRSKP